MSVLYFLLHARCTADGSLSRSFLYGFLTLNMHFSPIRQNAPELIDLPAGNYGPREYAGNLADIRKVNRFLGDRRAVLKHLPLLAASVATSPDRPLRLLDVATGSADIPAAIVKWARKRGIPVAITAVDINPQAIAEAARFAGPYPEITLAVADGFSLPFDDGAFDIVLCTKTLHHCCDEEAIRMLREVRRVSKTGYLVLDLRRSWIAWALISLLTKFFTLNRLTRHDGPLSVLRSYRTAELEALADRAGLSNHILVNEPFWLMMLTGRKERDE